MSWTSEQLSDLRTYAAEHRVVDSDCAMSLIAEVERLREQGNDLRKGARRRSFRLERNRQGIRLSDQWWSDRAR